MNFCHAVYVLWKKSNKVFRYISDVNKIITALAGGPNKTACDIGDRKSTRLNSSHPH